MEPTNEDLLAIETNGFTPLLLNDPLEDLFTEAQFAAANGKRQRRATNPSAKNALDAKTKTLHELFALSENWTRTKGVALIHKESETLLGNFSEYIHNSVPGARKLIRESEPISVTAAEYVEGNWWLPAEVTVKPREVWRERKRAIVSVQLPSLDLFAPVVWLEAHIAYGGIHRVELVEETSFATLDGNALVVLPAGVDILEAMSWDAKVALKKELGI